MAARNQGVIVSVRGSVVDARFAKQLPSIYSLLHTGPNLEIAIEVQAQPDAHLVRGIALTPTQGLARGMLIEEIDGVAPERHPMAAFLLEAGFAAGAMGLQATFRNRDL